MTRTDATITVQGGGGGGGDQPGEPPVADGGANLEVNEGDTATLNASASFHPDGEEATALLTFSWEQISGPPVQLTSADAATAFFTTVDDAVLK